MYRLAARIFGLDLTDSLLWSATKFLFSWMHQSVNLKEINCKSIKAALKWLHSHGSLGILQIIWPFFSTTTTLQIVSFEQRECVPLEHGNCILDWLGLNPMNYLYNWWVQVVWGHLIWPLIRLSKISYGLFWTSIYIFLKKVGSDYFMRGSEQNQDLCSVMNRNPVPNAN